MNVVNVKENKNELADGDCAVEYRNAKEFSHLSRPEQSDNPQQKNCKQYRQRSSEQPFERPILSENKLRRSFAVRSREGLENLLNFTSIRKGQDHAKSKEPGL